MRKTILYLMLTLFVFTARAEHEWTFVGNNSRGWSLFVSKDIKIPRLRHSPTKVWVKSEFHNTSVAQEIAGDSLAASMLELYEFIDDYSVYRKLKIVVYDKNGTLIGESFDCADYDYDYVIPDSTLAMIVRTIQGIIQEKQTKDETPAGL